MVLKNFFINVTVRVILIVFSCVVFGVVLQHCAQGYYFTLVGVSSIIVIQTFLLLHQVNKTNTDLEKFLSAVRDQESAVRFSLDHRNRSFEKLHLRMNDVNNVIQKVKLENERTSQFLKSVVEHIDTGLLSFDQNGRVEIINKTAESYLSAPQQQNIYSVNDDFSGILASVRPGQDVVHRIRRNDQVQNIMIKTAEMKFENKTVKLVSFQDITSELDRKELDSWQRLIRVLTHEIMNSVSPITSLASVISGYFRKRGEKQPLKPENIDNQVITKTLAGLDTIQETGKGLLDFVEKCRSFTSLPKPALCRFSVEDLFFKCRLLMESDIPQNIKITTETDPDDLTLEADYSQVEQVLINLIKNASEAMIGRSEGRIQMRAFSSQETTVIQVEDNGAGIADEVIQNIFVPFFTTKEYGSGIGLSLSKQIMQNHHGSITVNSVPGKGSVFSLRFQ
jgi:two-component system, NtrC family, nitrogen regulation sensor histidine kinase NtrY